MKNRRTLSIKEIQSILVFLFERFKDGQLERGALALAGYVCKLCHSTISRIWNHWHASSPTLPVPHPKVSCGRAGNGQSFFYDREEMIAVISELPIISCTMIQDIASHLRVSSSTVQRIIADEEILRPHYNKIKHTLLKDNK